MVAKCISLCSHKQILNGKLHFLRSVYTHSTKQSIEVCFSHEREKKMYPPLKFYSNNSHQKLKNV